MHVPFEACAVTTTVVSLDSVRGIVGLRSRLSFGAKGETDESIDMTVADGGVIVIETRRDLEPDSTNRK